jgi:hypothetical protein
VVKRGFTTKDSKEGFCAQRGLQTFVSLVSFVVQPFLVSAVAMSTGYVFA